MILPPRPEAAVFIPIAERIFKVFGDADCRTAFCVVGNEFIARGVLGDAEDQYLSFVDPDARVRHEPRAHPPPAFVHLRQDTTLVAAAEGWDPHEWQAVAKEVGKAMAWSVPGGGRPRRSPRPRPAGPSDRRPSRAALARRNCTEFTSAHAWRAAVGFARVIAFKSVRHPVVWGTDVCV